MNWTTFSRRRNVQLSSFISESKNLSDVLDMFRKKGITEPPIDDIVAIITERKVKATQDSSMLMNDPAKSEIQQTYQDVTQLLDNDDVVFPVLSKKNGKKIKNATDVD